MSLPLPRTALASWSSQRRCVALLRFCLYFSRRPELSKLWDVQAFQQSRHVGEGRVPLRLYLVAQAGEGNADPTRVEEFRRRRPRQERGPAVPLGGGHGHRRRGQRRAAEPRGLDEIERLLAGPGTASEPGPIPHTSEALGDLARAPRVERKDLSAVLQRAAPRPACPDRGSGSGRGRPGGDDPHGRQADARLRLDEPELHGPRAVRLLADLLRPDLGQGLRPAEPPPQERARRAGSEGVRTRGSGFSHSR